MKEALCNHCGASHLDKDWFSIHAHKKHLYAACGREFYDVGRSIGNPLISVKENCGDLEVFRATVPAKNKVLNINQKDYLGGIRIWGSNQVILWTAPKAEESGIHVHCHAKNGSVVIDDTFQEVIIDNIKLDAQIVRLWMAQSTLPHLAGRYVSLTCPSCNKSHCDRDELAYTPHKSHDCEHCGAKFITPVRTKLVISTPMPNIIESLTNTSPNPIQINTGFLRRRFNYRTRHIHRI